MLVIGKAADPQTLDPAVTIATDDQKEWSFTLKDNAKFADGTPVTAEAVKLSFERLLKIGQGPAEAFPKDLKIDAPDEHTVKFTLSQPFAPFLY
ncbi:ABC transporter substrate-binding protein, partial [Escherichia marmotae]|nr:ABC transporter substrate-binding protein [Escherichia marmotae]